MSSSGQPGAFEAVDYTGALRRRWPIVVAGAVVGLVAAFAYVTVAPKSYAATAAVSVSSTGADSSSSGASGGKSSSGLVNMNTEAQLVTSGTVAALAGHMMHSTLTSYQLAKQIAAVNPPNSSVLDITCTASTATDAATCANDFAAAYLQNRRTSASAVLNGEIKTLQDKINTLQKAMTKLNGQIAGLAKNSTTRLSDESVLAGDRTQVSSLNSQVVTLTGQAANVQGGHVITAATPPGKPKSPSKTIDLPVGLVAGLLIGLVAAFVRDRRDKRLHSVGDVERLLGLPVVLSLPRKTFGRQVSLASPRSRVGQAFTELAHTVAGSLGGEGSHVVVVAGTTAGPGASVVAANLAVALARTRGEAVLVCADLRDSVAPGLFGLPDGQGLAEVAAGLATVGDVASGPPGLPGLWVIPPGADPSLAEYHLQYDTAKALTSQLRRDARFVVIEAQAGDQGADSFALAEFADAAVLTVEAERVRRDEASAAIRRLGRIRVPVLGAAVIPPLAGRIGVRAFQPPARPAMAGRPGRGPGGRANQIGRATGG
jgi:capsular polysaccharide biosynthesis protein/Mrp family chromosome partitioning ATPase